MPYGQMGNAGFNWGGGTAGFQGINAQGGFDLPGSGSDMDWWDTLQSGIGTLGSNILAAINRPAAPTQQAGVGAVLGGAAGGLAVEGIEALVNALSQAGPSSGAMAAAAPGGLFRPPTASMKPRPVNMVQVMGPDGKCHTWLHATPKGWKVNASNVSGRRRRHSHPR